MAKYLLVRHGECVANVEKVSAGQKNAVIPFIAHTGAIRMITRVLDNVKREEPEGKNP